MRGLSSQELPLIAGMACGLTSPVTIPGVGQRHDPDRFSNREPHLTTRKQLELLLARLAQRVSEHVTSSSARDRIQQEMSQKPEAIRLDETNGAQRSGADRSSENTAEGAGMSRGGLDFPVSQPGRQDCSVNFFVAACKGAV